MSIVISVQYTPWDKTQNFAYLSGGREIAKDDFKVGDKVIVKTEAGTDMGQVIKIDQDSDEEIEKSSFILKKANPGDLEKIAKKNKQKKKTIKVCEELVKKHKLPMKLVDVHFSYDGGRIVFAYIAPERVDFRALVKDLARHFHKSVRMHQVGVREEAGFSGDIGPCGQPLCCLKFLKALGNVSTELVYNQQLSHRGTDRLSGICGRLKCCLLFEEASYKELVKNLPPIDSIVKTKRGQGRVVNRHILAQSIDVEIEKGTIINVPIKDIK